MIKQRQRKTFQERIVGIDLSTLSLGKAFTIVFAFLTLIVAFLSGTSHVSQAAVVLNAAPGAVDGTITGTATCVNGIIVTAYDSTGNSASATTASGGTYSILASAGAPSALSGDVRVEFSLPGDGSLDFCSPGLAGNTTVQFGDIDAGMTASAEYIDYSFYCGTPENQIRYAVTCFVNGDPDVTANLNDAAVATALYSDRSGISQNSIQKTVNVGDVGATWGLAYEGYADDLYLSAVVKRHMGLTEDSNGNALPGAIFHQSDPANPNTMSLFYDFGTLAGSDVQNNATRFPVGSGLDGSVDSLAFSQVGKRGLGDIEMSNDLTTLYATNLNDRQVYAIDMATTTGSGDAVALPNAPWLDNTICGVPATGVARPWGLQYHHGSIYVGVVCDGSTTTTCSATGACSDLTAHIFGYDGSGWSTLITVMDLSYERGLYNPDGTSVTRGITHWHPWSDNYGNNGGAGFDMEPYVGQGVATNYVDTAYPQPVLADIEFIEDGTVAIGMLDRSSMQFGYQQPGPDGASSTDKAVRYFAAGDVLRIGYTSDGSSLTLENNGLVYDASGTLLTSANSYNFNQGPGGQEFYDDQWSSNIGNPTFTTDIAVGGIAYLPGGDLIYGSSDAFSFYGAGIRMLDNDDGSDQGGIQVFTDNSAASGQTPAKSGGLGDIELFCAAAPIEIGNFIWIDADGDGIQDPDEAPLANVVVGLYDDSGNLIATVATDANGNYLFSSATGSDTNSTDYGMTLDPNGSYTVAVLDSNYDPGGALDGFIPTPTANAEGTTNDASDNSDSDGVSVTAGTGTDAASLGVSFTGNGPGENNHNFDFGFVELGAISGTITADTDGDGVGNTPIANVVLELLDSSGNPVLDSNGNAITVTTDANGDFLFDNVVPGDYTVVERQPAGYADVSEAEGGADGDHPDNGVLNSIDVTVEAGETDAGNDFVEEQFGAISGNVIADTDGDSVPDTPLAGVVLELLDNAGNPVLDASGNPITTTTDANGDYLFSDVLPGDYQIAEQQPQGYADQSETDGGDDADNPDNGIVNNIPVTVNAGETDSGNDFIEELEPTSVSMTDGSALSLRPIALLIMAAISLLTITRFILVRFE